MKKLILALIAAVVIVVVAYAFIEARPHLPRFTAQSLDGATWSEQNLQGKITLINFWYPSCDGCDEEMPHLIQLHQQFGDPFQVLTIALNYNNLNEVKNYVDLHKLPFPVVYDVNNQIAGDFDIQFTPSSLLVDKDGNIIRKEVGIIDSTSWSQSIQTQMKH